MTQCRLILMNNGVREYDFIGEVEKPLIDESITMESDSALTTYEIVLIQHVFGKNGVFKYVMVTGIRKK